MGRKDGENLNVICPCCQAKLVIDPIFGAVPELTDNTNDFTAWPASYSDGIPVSFPNM